MPGFCSRPSPPFAPVTRTTVSLRATTSTTSEGHQVLAEVRELVRSTREPATLKRGHQSFGDLSDVAPGGRTGDQEAVTANLGHDLPHALCHGVRGSYQWDAAEQ